MATIRVTLRLNEAELMRRLEAGFDRASQQFADETRLELESVKWNWTGLTKRRNGALVGSPRDIVDTGQLRDSQDVIATRRFRHRHSWQTPYALGVHQGMTYRSGTRVPARPWTRAPKVRLLQNFVNATDL